MNPRSVPEGMVTCRNGVGGGSGGSGVDAMVRQQFTFTKSKICKIIIIHNISPRLLEDSKNVMLFMHRVYGTCIVRSHSNKKSNQPTKRGLRFGGGLKIISPSEAHKLQSNSIMSYFVSLKSAAPKNMVLLQIIQKPPPK